jgi:hypothetical protein
VPGTCARAPACPPRGCRQQRHRLQGGARLPGGCWDLVRRPMVGCGAAPQVYAASVMFGYFLRRVDKRFQLEKALGTLPVSQEDAVARLERLFAAVRRRRRAAGGPDRGQQLRRRRAGGADEAHCVASPDTPPLPAKPARIKKKAAEPVVSGPAARSLAAARAACPYRVQAAPARSGRSPAPAAPAHPSMTPRPAGRRPGGQRQPRLGAGQHRGPGRALAWALGRRGRGGRARARAPAQRSGSQLVCVVRRVGCGAGRRAGRGAGAGYPGSAWGPSVAGGRPVCRV